DMDHNLRGRVRAGGTGALNGIRNAHERVSGTAIAVRRRSSIDKKACGLCRLGRRRQNGKYQQTDEHPCEADPGFVQISPSRAWLILLILAVNQGATTIVPETGRNCRYDPLQLHVHAHRLWSR